MRNYFDISSILDYGKFINMIVGGRGIGKTYSTKCLCVRRFLKSGTRFIYLRRYATELENVSVFFDDIKNSDEFANVDFDVKGGKFYINGSIAGFYFALTSDIIRKGTSFTNVSCIFFDEFLLENTQCHHYLKNEMRYFMSVLESVFRDRKKCFVIMLSNNVTSENIYSRSFNVKQPRNKKRVFTNEIVLYHEPDSEDFLGEKKDTDLYKLSVMVGLDKYMYNNDSLNDNDIFIGNKSGGGFTYGCTFILSGEKVGMWINQQKGILVLSSDIMSSPSVYALTREDHSPNSLFFATSSNNYYIKLLRAGFQTGNILFENQHIKSLFMSLRSIF